MKRALRLITWKQFAQAVETALYSNGIDPSDQPVHLVYVDFSFVYRITALDIRVDTSEMPTRCRVRIEKKGDTM